MIGGLADGLALAASPVFAGLALWSAWKPAEGIVGLCSAVGGSPLAGMAVMYLVMSAVHLPAWLHRVPHWAGRSGNWMAAADGRKSG